MEQRNKALIVGMAKSGIGAAKLLSRSGWDVIINDKKTEIAGLSEALDGISVDWRLGEEPQTLFDGVSLIVISPIIPMTVPFVRAAKERGIEVISEIETPERVLRDVTPLSLTEDGAALCASEPDGRQIAVIAVISADFAQGERISAILHEYHPYLVGRMGLPYPDAGLHIITVTLDAPGTVVRELAGRLEALPKVSVKTTFAREINAKGDGKHDEP